MRAVVTGSEGFLGRHLVAELTARGWEVLPETVLVEGGGAPVDCLFHLRAWADAAGCERDPARACIENVAGSIHAGRLGRHGGVRRAVYASTTAVYRNQTHRRVVADLDTTGPVSVYATTKLAGEFAIEAALGPDAQLTVVRLPNLYGPGQRAGARGAVARWFEAVSVGRALKVYADAAAAPRDYVHVEDAAAALANAAHDSVGARRVIAATGRSVVGLELARLVCEAWAAVGAVGKPRVAVLAECDPVPAPLHAHGYEPGAVWICPTWLEDGLLEVARSLLPSGRGTEAGREAVDAERDGECPECCGTGRDGGSSAPCPACLAAAERRRAERLAEPAAPGERIARILSDAAADD